MAACNLQSDEKLRREHGQWIEEALSNGSKKRQLEWTESIAVGSQTFIERIQKKLSSRAKGRTVMEYTDYYQLREPSTAYNGYFRGEKGSISIENTFYLDLKVGGQLDSLVRPDSALRQNPDRRLKHIACVHAIKRQ